ncbi:MAG TPA: FUSC family protein [Acidimicrobiales bacterium]|nr:FUSC family protein [Acidimicrobiales bacterium]
MVRSRHLEMGDVPWPRIASAALTAGLVAVPLALGFATGHSVAGGIGALGAYLWTASHITDKRPIGLPIAVVTILLLGAAGVTGALGGRYLWFLVVMVVVWATMQAVTDVAGGPLRVPVALSALCMLLSAIGGGHTLTGALWQGLLTLGGAAWITGTELVRHPPWRSPGPEVTSLGLKSLVPAWPRARGFALLLVVPTALVAGIAGAFQISHGAWTATTVLRVLRPDTATTVIRSKQRAAGTVAGAILAAVLLAAAPTAVTALVVLVVAVTAMQLVGPRRYGVYTFFLTLIALQLGSIGHQRDWGIALIRAGLTVVGTAIAVISGVVYDRVTAQSTN